MRSVIFILPIVALLAYSSAYPHRSSGDRGDDNRERSEDRGALRHGEYNCHDAPDAGSCFAVFFRWYYDEQRGECLQFMWGGCGGNGNKFSSRSVCERHCRPRSSGRGQSTQLPADDSADELQSRRQSGSRSSSPSSRNRGGSGGEAGNRRHSSRRTSPLPPTNCDGRPMCMMYCQNGFKKGPDGCDVCDCN
jgi:hypothetical protein